MKKKLLAFLLILMSVMSVHSATYKVNSAGKISSPTGQVQQSAKTSTVKSPYNNYNAGSYVSSNTVNKVSVGAIEIVMDFSGSMTDWVMVAKQTMSGIVSQIPQNTLVGFRVFGHGGDITAEPQLAQVTGVTKSTKNGKTTYKINTNEVTKSSSFMGCSATKQVTPVSTLNTYSLLNGMNSVALGGSTPLVLALKQAANNDFSALSSDVKKKIVLITDGGENCGGDPCAFAKSLMAQRSDIHIDVVLVSSNSRALKCLSSTTGGKFYHANSYYDFSNVVVQSMTTTKDGSTIDNSNVEQYQTPSQNYEFIDDEF